AAFAGVSAGYSANFLLGPVDAILAGMSTEAVALVADDYVVSMAGNYYFAAASTLLLSLVGAWVTEKLVLPYLDRGRGTAPDPIAAMSPADRRGLWAVLAWTLLFVLLLALGTLPSNGVLRQPAQPD